MEWIDVFDLELNRIGALQTWISLVWREEYNTEGKLQIEVQQSEGVENLLKPWRYMQMRGKDTVMIIQSVKIRNKRIVIRYYRRIKHLKLILA